MYNKCRCLQWGWKKTPKVEFWTSKVKTTINLHNRCNPNQVNQLLKNLLMNLEGSTKTASVIETSTKLNHCFTAIKQRENYYLISVLERNSLVGPSILKNTSRHPWIFKERILISPFVNVNIQAFTISPYSIGKLISSWSFNF